MRPSVPEALLAALGLLAVTSHAHAEPCPQRDDASVAYKAAASALEQARFADAARDFAIADALCPHAVALEEALRAVAQADDPALCMRLADRALERGLHREHAITMRNYCAPLAGKLLLRCSAGCTARVDGQPAATGQEFWVRAGPHVVELVAADGSSTRHDTTVTAGETELVGHHSPPARSGNGLSLTWFTVGASLTAVSAAVLIWSGVDTLAQNDDFQAAPTVGKDANGRAAELRTNVLIGVTAGLAVATASLAAFTNWGTADEEEQGLAPTVSLKWTGAGAALSLDGAF